MGLKVLVTGASGQLGKTIEELFAKNNSNIYFTFASKSDLDITDQLKVEVFFTKNKFDYCINCAAYTNVEQAEKTPEMAFKINAHAVKSIAKSCKKNNVTLIHVSTDYVFDGEKTTPYTPEDLTNPINEYGKSKLLGESLIQDILKKYFIIRTSWLYSKKYGKNFYKTIVNLAKTKDELAITTDQKGCPTNTETLAKYIIGLIVSKNNNYGLKHFSDEKVMTWYDFAKEIMSENNLIQTTNLVKTSNYVTFAKRPKYSVLRTTKE